MINEILNYYNDLANTYDSNRFENTYGKFIHYQESFFLINHLNNNSFKTLDLGCGTGRFLNFANYGVDLSENMLEISKKKYPDKILKQGNVNNIPFENNYFDNILCMHVIMHLNFSFTKDFILEASKKNKNNGILIFDFPSKKRRNLFGFKSNNWHASNSFTIAEIKTIIKNKYEIEKIQGILFLPIHRFPKFTRKWFLKIDLFLCKSFLKEYASYLIIKLKKTND